jgi:hypothetical protein
MPNGAWLTDYKPAAFKRANSWYAHDFRPLA